MGVRCFACKIYKKGNSDLGFFSFPKDERLCTLWFEAINQPRRPGHTLEFCHASLRVCSKHFRPQDIVSNKIRKRLHPDAVPVFNTDDFSGTKAGAGIKNEDIHEDNIYESDLQNRLEDDQVLNDIQYKLNSLKKEELDIGDIEIKEGIINESIFDPNLEDQPDYVIICNHDNREFKLEDTEDRPKKRKKCTFEKCDNTYYETNTELLGHCTKEHEMKLDFRPFICDR